jgi:hypothetical protein
VALLGLLTQTATASNPSRASHFMGYDLLQLFIADFRCLSFTTIELIDDRLNSFED